METEQSKPSKPSKLDKYELEYLLIKAKKGDSDSIESLLKFMEPKLKMFSYKYYIRGLDQQDILQIARLGVVDAIKCWDSSKPSGFVNFAMYVVINAMLISELKKSQFQKRKHLNESVQLEDYISDNLSDGFTEDNLIDEIFGIDKYYEILSPLESSVLRKRIKGDSYKEITTELDLSYKSVDNSLFRAKNKIKQITGIHLVP